MEYNRTYLRFFNILLAIVAYGFLLYKLITFSDYSLFIAHFQTVKTFNILCLFIALLLMPLNIFLESAKWRELLRNVEPMTYNQAQKQVYYGFVGAFITPYRAGDYPARTLMMQDPSKWPAAIGLGLVGTAMLLLIEIIFGIPSLLLFTSYELQLPTAYVILAFVMLVILLVSLPYVFRFLSKKEWKYEKFNQLFNALSSMQFSQCAKVLAWSAARYVVWGLQAVLIFMFCGVTLTPMEYLIAIPLYYLAIALFPTLPLADIAIRGSWAIVIFGVFTSNTAGIALAITMVWILNTILPMIIGTFFAGNIHATNKHVLTPIKT